MFGQVGSLGLPGTKWNRGEVLDAQLQSRGLSTLLLELVQRGELHIEPDLCVVMMGLGCGANALLHFAATKPLDPDLVVLLDSTRFLVVINPLPLAPTSSTEAHQVKRSIQTLKRVLERGKHHEQLQALTTAFFSDEFISQVSSGCHLHLRRKVATSILCTWRSSAYVEEFPRAVLQKQHFAERSGVLLRLTPPYRDALLSA